MANEITASGSLAYSKNGVADSLARIGLAITMSGDDALHQSQLVGFAAEETLTLNSDASTNGWLLLINRDTTNFVKVRAATGAADLVKIKAGEFALFRLNTGITPYVIADTAAVRLEVLHIED